MTKISDLPMDLTEEVLSRLPMTSLRAVRFTCNKWNTLSKRRSFTKKQMDQAKAEAKKEFQAIMTMDNRVYLMSINLDGVNKEDKVESSIKQKGKLISLDDADPISISQVYHCDGLLLCITNDINSRLVVWNPYRGKTMWIKPINSYHKRDIYAIGYEMKNNAIRSYKILRFLDAYKYHSDDMSVEHRTRICELEIYTFDSNSWKVIEVTPDWSISFLQRGESLKGNIYWFASEEIVEENPHFGEDDEIPSFLLCFDFTTERFGSRLPLPLPDTQINDTAFLSTVGEEQLAVLYQRWTIMWRRIWISSKIEPNAVSWSTLFLYEGEIRELLPTSGSFLVDKEEKVAVIFDKGQCRHKPTRNIAYIVGENEYIKEVDLGESVDKYCFPLVCSYVPSSVQF